MRRRTFLMLPLLLGGCSLVTHTVSTSTNPPWQTISATAIVSDLAAVHAGESKPPTPPDAVTVAAWQQPIHTWVQRACASIARDWVSPPRAARAYALLLLGMDEVLRTVDIAYQQGLVASPDAALAAVAAHIGSYNHPLLADQWNTDAATAQWMGVWAGREDADAVARGLRIGERVGQQVRTWAAHDHADDPAFFPDRSAEPGMWQRTPPRLWSPLDPGWGRVKPLRVQDVTTYIPPPPAWNSAAFEQERAAFLAVQAQVVEADHAQVRYWAAGMGTMTPAGMWLELAQGLLQRDDLTGLAATTVLSTLAAAMHDAFVVAWHAKYTYAVARPITWMRETNPDWLGVIETPPFPSYPSGHSIVSSTAATVLARFFPSDAPALIAQATAASRSRVLGGIHWQMDCTVGLRAGQQIGLQAIAPLSHIPST